jgi:hypothetical protein
MKKSGIILGVIWGLFGVNFAGKADTDSKLIGNWRSAMIPIMEGVVKLKIGYKFKTDGSCAFQLDVLTTLDLGNSANRREYECVYTLPATGKVDMRIMKIFYTQLDGPAANQANEDAECGLHDWVPGQRRDVTNLGCDDFGPPGAGEEVVMKDVYEITADGTILYFGQNYMKDESEGDQDVPRDQEGRPLAVIKNVGFAIDGVVPPEVRPRPRPVDTLTGLYEIERLTLNSQDCSQEGPPENSNSKYLYVFPLAIVMPFPLPGWSSKECDVRAGCDTPDGWMFGSPFSIEKVVDPDQLWIGKTTTTEASGAFCDGTLADVEVKRIDAHSLVFTSKIQKARVPVYGEGRDRCATKDPRMVAALNAAVCQSVRVARVKRVD